jgi:hypothetical protein
VTLPPVTQSIQLPETETPAAPLAGGPTTAGAGDVGELTSPAPANQPPAGNAPAAPGKPAATASAGNAPPATGPAGPALGTAPVTKPVTGDMPPGIGYVVTTPGGAASGNDASVLPPGSGDRAGGDGFQRYLQWLTVAETERQRHGGKAVPPALAAARPPVPADCKELDRAFGAGQFDQAQLELERVVKARGLDLSLRLGQ